MKKINFIKIFLTFALILQISILIFKEEKKIRKEEIYLELDNFIKFNSIDPDSLLTDFNYFYYKNNIPFFNREISVVSIYNSLEDCNLDRFSKYNLLHFKRNTIDKSAFFDRLESCENENFHNSYYFNLVEIGGEIFLFIKK